MKKRRRLTAKQKKYFAPKRTRKRGKIMAKRRGYRSYARRGIGGMKTMLAPIASGVADSYLDPMLPLDGIGSVIVGGFLLKNSTMKDLGLYKVGFSLGNILPLPRGSFTGGGNIGGGGFL